MVKQCKICRKEYEITPYEIEFDEGKCLDCQNKELQNIYNLGEKLKW